MQKFDSTNPTDNAISLICKNPNPTITFQQRTKKLKRNHYKCKICDCIFVPNKYHLNETLQKVESLTDLIEFYSNSPLKKLKDGSSSI